MEEEEEEEKKRKEKEGGRTSWSACNKGKRRESG